MAFDFLSEWKRNYFRRRMQGVMADILARCVDQFTPEGLEAAIRDGWSPVDFLSKLTVAELKDFLMSIPSLRSAPPSNPTALQESLSHITAQDMIAEMLKRLPRHGKVLSQNPQWLAKELSKAKSLLG